MLLWGLVAGVPIVLHFLTRRYYTQTPWAAMQFVLAAQIKTQRKFRIWQWLMLAIRVIAVLVFALAVADPVLNWASAPQPTQSSVPTVTVLVVDASMSMKVTDGTATRWQQVCAMIHQRLEQAETADSFLLLLAESRPRWIIADATHDRQATLVALDSMTPSDQEADMVAAINAAINQAQPLKSDSAPDQRIRIELYSDAQAVSWDKVLALDMQPVPFELELVNIGENEVANASVQSLALSQSLCIAGQPLRIEATIGFGTSPMSQPITAQLWVDDQVRESRQVQPRQDQQETLSWTVTLGEGEHRVKVQISDDALMADNRRLMVVQVRSQLQIACVGRDEASTRFVAAAMRSGNRQSITARQMTWSSWNTQPHDRLDMIVLCDLSGFDERQADRIQAALKQGTSVMIWLGPDTDADRFKHVFDNAARWPELSIGRLVAREGPSDYPIDPLGYHHPAIEVFGKYPESGLATMPVFQYWTLQLHDAASVQTLLGIGKSDPLLVCKSLTSGGRLLVMATAASPVANSVASRGANPAANPSANPSASPAANPVASDAADQPDSAQSSASTPWNAIALSSVFPPLMQQLLSFATTEPNRDATVEHREAGFYPLNDSPASTWIAVNPSPEESRLRRMDEASLRAIQARQSVHASAVENLDESKRAREAKLRLGMHRGNGWAVLVCGAIALLSAESVLRWYILPSKTTQ